jgi:hypothetical protein
MVRDKDEAERLFMRGPDMWVRMKSGREIKLGPVEEVENSIRRFLVGAEEIQPPPLNRAS